MWLTEHIALVGSSRFGLSNPYDCSIYALRSSVGIVLVDAGCGLEPELIAVNLQNVGLDLSGLHALVLTHTHADHYGQAAEIAHTSNAAVWTHRHNRAQLEAYETIRAATGGRSRWPGGSR